MPTFDVRDLTRRVGEDAADFARLSGLGGHSDEPGTDHLHDPLLADTKRSAPDKVHQDSDSLDGILSTARASNEHFMSVVRGIAESTGGKPLLAPIKGLGRIKEKIAKDYDGDSSRITDAVRGTVVYKTVEEARSGLAHIERLRAKKNVKDIRGIPSVKMRFVPEATGYKDINLLIELGNGFLCELQLHVEAIADAKEDAGHKVYDVLRVLEKKKDSLSEGELAELAAMQAFSDEIYATAEELAKTGGTVDNAVKTKWAKHPTMRTVEAWAVKLGVAKAH